MFNEDPNIRSHRNKIDLEAKTADCGMDRRTGPSCYEFTSKLPVKIDGKL